MQRSSGAGAAGRARTPKPSAPQPKRADASTAAKPDKAVPPSRKTGNVSGPAGGKASGKGSGKPSTKATKKGAPPAFVVGVDFSRSNLTAVGAAIQAARRVGGRIVLVHALTPLGAPGLAPSRPRTDPARNESADVTAAAPSLAMSPASLWKARVKAAGIPVEYVARPGNAVHVLVEEAERVQAKAIVVGHAAQTATKQVLGSVARRVVTRSRVPVMVVPEREEKARTEPAAAAA